MLSTTMMFKVSAVALLGLASLSLAEDAAAPSTVPTTQASTDAHAILGGGDLFPAATPAAMLNVTKSVFPAVVRLDVAQETYADGKRVLQRGIGSGVIIDGQGHILTNYHVAGRAAEIYVTLSNKERVKGKLIGDDHWTDIAVVQMDMDEVHTKQFEFAYASIGDSSKLVPGQDVIAVGTPFGLARTLTLGVVSNTERTFYPEKQDIDEYETGEFSNWIQMDTPIAPGNSGGPLVDLDGMLVGINTRGIQGQALNFAIPINTAKRVADEILATADPAANKRGRVTRSYLGMDFRPLQDLENFYAIDINKGALVSTVDKGSPAALAGLKPQDILLALNGQAINVRFPEELAAVKQMIAALPLKQDVEMLVRRGKEELTITAKTEKQESRVGEEREFKDWGISVRDITRLLAVDRRLDDDLGVIVTSVTSGFPAGKADLDSGDIIRRIDGVDATDLDAFIAIYTAAQTEKRESILVEIKRGRAVQSKVLKLK